MPLLDDLRLALSQVGPEFFGAEMPWGEVQHVEAMFQAELYTHMRPIFALYQDLQTTANPLKQVARFERFIGRAPIAPDIVVHQHHNLHMNALVIELKSRVEIEARHLREDLDSLIFYLNPFDDPHAPGLGFACGACIIVNAPVFRKHDVANYWRELETIQNLQDHRLSLWNVTLEAGQPSIRIFVPVGRQIHSRQIAFFPEQFQVSPELQRVIDNRIREGGLA